MKSFHKRSIRLVLVLSMSLVIFGASASYGSAQRRDYMTDAEIELVRDNQDVDLRITVLVRMIDRRFQVLGIEVGGWKPKPKELENWGEQPTGTRREIFTDIRHLVQKAVDDIDTIAERNEDALKQNKTDGELFPKAVRILAEAAKRYLPQLNAAATKTSDESEKGQILNAAELCEQIIASVVKLPPEPVKKKN
ncbi:MAG: hypothetical protein ACT4O9_16735 [Blastocatellia bacterium]